MPSINKILTPCKSDLPKNGREIASYRLIEIPKIEIPAIGEKSTAAKTEEPAVKSMLPQQPSPLAKKKSLIGKILARLFAKESDKKPTNKDIKRKPYHNPHQRYNTYKKRNSSYHTRRGTRGGGKR